MSSRSFRGRQYAYLAPEDFSKDSSKPSVIQPTPVDSAEEGNLISSKSNLINDLHHPVIDLDFPAELVPSATPGHFHLYLDVGLTWAEYVGVLFALAAAGVIQEGFYRASLEKGATFVRKHGVKKGEEKP